MKHLTYKGYDIVLIRGGRKGSGSYAYLIHQGDEGRVSHTSMGVRGTSEMQVALSLKQDIQFDINQDIQHREWFVEYMQQQEGVTA